MSWNYNNFDTKDYMESWAVLKVVYTGIQGSSLSSRHTFLSLFVSPLRLRFRTRQTFKAACLSCRRSPVSSWFVCMGRKLKEDVGVTAGAWELSRKGDGWCLKLWGKNSLNFMVTLALFGVWGRAIFNVNSLCSRGWPEWWYYRPVPSCQALGGCFTDSCLSGQCTQEQSNEWRREPFHCGPQQALQSCHVQTYTWCWEP